ncbi:hypothetical protein J4474_00785, partial [Candidatus Pacearchaeota archaeon]|nr:hypothetical protein [Candidatus Pacearchaeota archaeon]
DYGNFLSENKIPKMPVSFGSLQKGKTFARKMWFWDLDVLSGLGGVRGLGDGSDGVRGVREDATASERVVSTAVGGSQPALYLSADLDVLREVRKGNVAPKELEKILSRFS